MLFFGQAKIYFNRFLVGKRFSRKIVKIEIVKKEIVRILAYIIVGALVQYSCKLVCNRKALEVFEFPPSNGRCRLENTDD